MWTGAAMIVTFRSPASGDVIMFAAVANRLLAIMGKEATPEGIFTVEQIPDAIARLRAAVAEDKARQVPDDDENPPRGMAAPVTLAQRAVPLLELLDWSLRKKKPVTWS